tara:strand:+ start:1408 stop:1686 length:279 start_codon:yes stop_codon:yes gene_type:complete
MPSPRKRIGFLPTAEVQKIINQICSSENISQSKVTGILVNEALKARDINKDIPSNKINENNSYESEMNMIKEYLEYKRFKKMLKIINSEENN